MDSTEGVFVVALAGFPFVVFVIGVGALLID
jgi:hypothetical protein